MTNDPDTPTRVDKPSRAAEYIAALYVALVLCTPWLLREAPWLTPPSKGVEIQMSNTAQMQAAAEHDAVLARRPAPAGATGGNHGVHANAAR